MCAELRALVVESNDVARTLIGDVNTGLAAARALLDKAGA